MKTTLRCWFTLCFCQELIMTLRRFHPKFGNLSVKPIDIGDTDRQQGPRGVTNSKIQDGGTSGHWQKAQVTILWKLENLHRIWSRFWFYLKNMSFY